VKNIVATATTVAPAPAPAADDNDDDDDDKAMQTSKTGEQGQISRAGGEAATVATGGSGGGIGSATTATTTATAAANANNPTTAMFPDVPVMDETGATVQSRDVVAGNAAAVVFLYPKANTPGCTKQACGFGDAHDELRAAGYAVFGLSYDTPKSQRNWKAKHKLPYHLLCDTLGGGLIAKLGAGKAPKGIKRSHFVVAQGGAILDTQLAISPADSVAKACEFVRAHKTGAALPPSVPADDVVADVKMGKDKEGGDDTAAHKDMKDDETMTEDVHPPAEAAAEPPAKTTSTTSGPAAPAPKEPEPAPAAPAVAIAPSAVSPANGDADIPKPPESGAAAAAPAAPPPAAIAAEKHHAKTSGKKDHPPEQHNVAKKDITPVEQAKEGDFKPNPITAPAMDDADKPGKADKPVHVESKVPGHDEDGGSAIEKLEKADEPEKSDVVMSDKPGESVPSSDVHKPEVTPA
jgi:thioredoxin-dependent peroxiredoxin